MTHTQKVCVTGGNGFVGSRVVRLLVEREYEVRCLLRNSSNTERIKDLAFEQSMGDVRNADSIAEAMEGCDGVIHLACLSNWDDIHSPMMRQVVVDGSKNVLDVAKRCGKLPTVFVSSILAVNGTKESKIHNEQSAFSLTDRNAYSYAFAKREVEALCLTAVADGLPVTIVNPAEVYGPGDHELITAGNLVDFATSNPILIPTGGTSVVHVDDVARGIVAALFKGRPGERYILGGDNLNLYELSDLTMTLLGQQKRIITLPNPLLVRIATIGSTLGIPLPFNPAVIPYAVHYWWMDNSKARAELGVEFRSARETLEPTIRWLQEKGIV